MIKDARTRITELNASIQKWEQFETLLAKFREWHDHVDVILSCRASDDVSALDVPDEYKVLFFTCHFSSSVFFFFFLVQ